MNQARRENVRANAASAPRILVVEDESDLAVLLSYNLEAEGYVVESVERGDEAELRLAENPPDLVILDWMLPGRLGPRDLPQAARPREHAHASRDHGDGARRGGGARSRPVGRRRRLRRQAVFGARNSWRACARSCAAAAPSGSPTVSRPATSTSTARPGACGAESRDIHLGPTEFRLLEYLLEKPGRVFTRAQLLDGVWGQAAEIDERTVDVHVGRLRKALSRGRERDPIRTVRGTGYAFDETFGKS